MPSRQEFDALMDDTPETMFTLGSLPWDEFGIEVRPEGKNFEFGTQHFGEDLTELGGVVRVDGNHSIQKQVAGPLVEHDAPLGIMPSTLFTPFPRDILGIDLEYIQLMAMMAMVATLGSGVGVFGGGFSN